MGFACIGIGFQKLVKDIENGGPCGDWKVVEENNGRINDNDFGWLGLFLGLGIRTWALGIGHLEQLWELD